jgi:hypothetical protein
MPRQTKKPPRTRGASSVHQFKITLRHVRPAVWRRIQVPLKYSFYDLHVAIQDVFGWLDYHLHAFRIRNPTTGGTDEIGIPDDEYGEPCLAGWEVKLSEYFVTPKRKALYLYDFGDGWEHDVLYEGEIPVEPKVRYPRCVAGARACPPEDCGGPYGYERLLRILADPTDPEHPELLAWVGHPIDPSAFDLSDVTFNNPRTRWKIAFEAEQGAG